MFSERTLILQTLYCILYILNRAMLNLSVYSLLAKSISEHPVAKFDRLQLARIDRQVLQHRRVSFIFLRSTFPTFFHSRSAFCFIYFIIKRVVISYRAFYYREWYRCFALLFLSLSSKVSLDRRARRIRISRSVKREANSRSHLPSALGAKVFAKEFGH